MFYEWLYPGKLVSTRLLSRISLTLSFVFKDCLPPINQPKSALQDQSSFVKTQERRRINSKKEKLLKQFVVFRFCYYLGLEDCCLVRAASYEFLVVKWLGVTNSIRRQELLLRAQTHQIHVKARNSVLDRPYK